MLERRWGKNGTQLNEIIEIRSGYTCNEMERRLYQIAFASSTGSGLVINGRFRVWVYDFSRKRERGEQRWLLGGNPVAEAPNRDHVV